MENLFQKYYEKISRQQTNYIRDFITTIDWSNRMIGIKGSRGVGKTTLLLQYLKTHFELNNKVLYVSLDDMYFVDRKLYDLVSEFYKKGGELIAIDEVHRYSNWAIELKNIYDDFHDLKIIFTGSSLLHITHAKADLSRRAVIYEMYGLSFREFLYFETDIRFPTYSLESLLLNHISLAAEIIKKIKPLAYYSDYLNYGYYPFYKENVKSYHQKLSEIILTILEVDIPQFAGIQTSNIIYLKKLLKIISVSVPFKPNMNALSVRTGISVNTLKDYIYWLNEAQLIQLLYVESAGINSMNKPEKIYLNNTNIMYNMAEENANIGNIRETFFFNQLSRKYPTNASKETDFIINRISFEIGGKSKQKKQIANLTQAFIVKDSIEIGSENIIPLSMFGMLY